MYPEFKIAEFPESLLNATFLRAGHEGTYTPVSLKLLVLTAF